MDDVDKTEAKAAVLIDADVALIRQKVQAIDPGYKGECVECAEERPRLILGVCCFCRDKLGLP